MSQSLLQSQTALPASIHLFRYNPERTRFPWNVWDPSKVRTAHDLPPYLILGPLDEQSVKVSAAGWSALWQGTEHDTHFAIRYLADKARYEIRQTWCGVDGGFSNYPSRIPLDKLILQALYTSFPLNWDHQAKKSLERNFQITYIEQPEKAFGFAGMPDGALRTIAFPIAIKNLRPVREWLKEIVSDSVLSYPISAEAKLLFQAVNYLEGKAPEWTTSEAVVFNHSLAETGIVPYSVPVKETADDGSSAWTLYRDVYVLFIGLPFAGLTDFMERMCTTKGPIRTRSDPTLRVELQPVVMPAAFELQSQSISFWDKEKTTRCFWQFHKPNENPNIQTVEEVMKNYAVADDLLRAAESISSEVTGSIQHIMNKIFVQSG